MNRVIFLVNCAYGLVVSHEEGSILVPEGSVLCFSTFIEMEEVCVKAADIT